MKLVVQFAVLGSLFISLSSEARVIYGEDNRSEISDVSPMFQKLARSTATMIPKLLLFSDPNRNNATTVYQNTFAEWMRDQNSAAIGKAPIGFCSSERFVDQPNPGVCTGFLIAPDLLVTAGHCAEDNFCDEYKWVFDFKVDPVSKKAGIGMDADNVYSCKKLITQILSTPLGLDYAVVQLDRRVIDREPLEVRTDGKIEDFTQLVLIGSPEGLPLKFVDGAVVRDNSRPNSFMTNTDSFEGNSGSPIFDASSGIIEGILVSGEEDFVFNKAQNCMQSKRCQNDECRGEGVSRINSIPEIALLEVLKLSAKTGDMASLNQILNLKIYVDFNGKDGVTALMDASAGNQLAAMKLLISHGADLNRIDGAGNTVLHHLISNFSENSSELLNLIPVSQYQIKNDAGETPIDIANKNENQLAMKALMVNSTKLMVTLLNQ